MNETLFERTHSTVFASATLAVDDKFDAFESAWIERFGAFDLSDVQAGFKL